MSLLEIKDLNIEFPTRRGTVNAVRGISMDVAPGEILGVVGESGAGKSTIGNAVMDLLQAPGRVSGGNINFEGTDLRSLSSEDMRKMRGAKIGMIFQDPQTSLNPLTTIGKQLGESIRNARGLTDREAQLEALRLLEAVGIPHAQERLKAYPHELSGGMRQRVVIALALCGDPDLIIADEPTTALDVSIQKQILELIQKLCRERQLGVLLITHDIGVISQIADRVAVMYDGQVVETGTTAQILHAPTHEYTRSLIAAVPRLDVKMHRFTTVEHSGSKKRTRSEWLNYAADQANDATAIEAKNLSLGFVLKKAFLKGNRTILKAVDDVSFAVASGETFGIVGESGSGKSTLARIIAGLYAPDEGSVSILGVPMSDRRSVEEKAACRKLQMIFQDPYSSLNSRMKVSKIIAEPINFYKLSDSRKTTERAIGELLEYVGLPPEAANRYPHEFSGGQRQRISIARALAARPRILICDEPTSALDVSIQAQILNLLKDLQEEFALTMLFISHDLPVIRQMCDRIGVMKAGQMVELATGDALFSNPEHAYTQELIANIPAFSPKAL